jgi:Tfp pilus assembly protein PilF
MFETGDPLGAARLLEPIVTAEPSNAAARLLLARSYFHSAQLRRAEAQLRILIERDPTDHYALFVLGRTLERMGRPADALRQFRIAAAMHRQEEYDRAVARLVARLA